MLPIKNTHPKRFIVLLVLVLSVLFLRSPIMGCAAWVDTHSGTLSLLITVLVYMDQKNEARQLRQIGSELGVMHQEQKDQR